MIPCRYFHIDEDGTKRLTSTYRELENITGLLTAALKQDQALEEATWDVINSRGLGVCRVPVPLKDDGCCQTVPDLAGATRVAVILDAEGVHIDPIGGLVGESRDGRLDPEFLIGIKARIRANKSSGRCEDLIQIARLATPYGTGVDFQNGRPGHFTLGVYGYGAGTPTLARVLGIARMGGVQGLLRYAEEPEADLFSFGSVSSPAEGTTVASTYGGDTDPSHFAAITET